MRKLAHLAAACGASLVLALALFPSDAEGREVHLEFQGSFDAYTTFIRSMPRLTLSDTDVGSRSVHGKLPSSGNLSLVGAALDATWTANDRWVIPMLGVGLAGAVGSSPRVLGSVDGSIAELRPWSGYMGDILLPGFGARFKERRWMFSMLVRTGISISGMSGTVATGTDTANINPWAVSFLVRAQLEGCRRLDPLERVCLVVAPSIYQFGFGNGITAGLRWEIGP